MSPKCHQNVTGAQMTWHIGQYLPLTFGSCRECHHDRNIVSYDGLQTGNWCHDIWHFQLRVLGCGIESWCLWYISTYGYYLNGNKSPPGVSTLRGCALGGTESGSWVAVDAQFWVLWVGVLWHFLFLLYVHIPAQKGILEYSTWLFEIVPCAESWIQYAH